jgi:hypothetical protein
LSAGELPEQPLAVRLHYVLKYEGKPGWFSLIARAAAPQGLLPFRYTVGIVLKAFSTQRLAGWETKSRPGGAQPPLQRW